MTLDLRYFGESEGSTYDKGGHLAENFAVPKKRRAKPTVSAPRPGHRRRVR